MLLNTLINRFRPVPKRRFFPGMGLGTSALMAGGAYYLFRTEQGARLREKVMQTLREWLPTEAKDTSARQGVREFDDIAPRATTSQHGGVHTPRI